MQNKPISVGYVVHNKAFLIPQIIEGLKKSFSTEDEFIFLFDNCSDGSEKLEIEAKKIFPNVVTQINGGEDLFETKANNAVLKHFMEGKNDTVILWQDDIICNDPRIKEKIFKIQEEVSNLGLIGGRSGYDLISTQFPEMPINKVSNWEHKDDQYGTRLEKGQFERRTFLNRGPVVFTRQLIEKAGYLDEAYYPQQFDDMDYCARCKYQYGLENIVFQCGVVSKIEWGTTRDKNSNLRRMFRGKHYKKNWNLFCSRWATYFVK